MGAPAQHWDQYGSTQPCWWQHRVLTHRDSLLAGSSLQEQGFAVSTHHGISLSSHPGHIPAPPQPTSSAATQPWHSPTACPRQSQVAAAGECPDPPQGLRKPQLTTSHGHILPAAREVGICSLPWERRAQPHTPIILLGRHSSHSPGREQGLGSIRPPLPVNQIRVCLTKQSLN